MLYNKAIDWELFEGKNPATRIRKFKLQPRERFLHPEEVPRFLAAVKTLRHQTTEDVLLMLLYTAQRRRNVCEMRWEDIDFSLEVWRIPTTKNGTSHYVPLVREALEVLERRQSDPAKHSIWVFPLRDGSGPIWSLSTAWKVVVARAKLKDFRIHDLRRSHASYQAITGVNAPIIGATLNHKDPKSTQIYTRLYLDPIRNAMQQAVDAMLAKVETGTRIRLISNGTKRANLKVLSAQSTENKDLRSRKAPHNFGLKITDDEQNNIETRIIQALADAPLTKSAIHQMFGALRLNFTELERILNDLLADNRIRRFRGEPHWYCWQYAINTAKQAVDEEVRNSDPQTIQSVP